MNHAIIHSALLLSACCSSLALAQASPQPSVEPDRPVSGVIQSGAQRQPIEILLSPGDFVRGSLEGEKLTLWLVNGSGAPVRRLAAGVGSQQPFMFVAGDEGPYRLEVGGSASTGYTLRTEAVVSLANQVAPETPLASPLLRRLQQTLADGGDTAAFWQRMQQQGTPLVEMEDVLPALGDHEALVTFLWRGAKRNVRLFGAPSGDHDELHRLGESDVWYRSYRVPKSARIAYRVAPDVPHLNTTARQQRRAILATLQRDPLNPHYEPTAPVDAYEGFSVVALPEADAPLGLQPNPKHPSGVVETFSLTSEILGNTRDIHIARSPGYVPGAEGNALAVIFDGERYLDEVKVATILDHLVAEKKIPPIAAVLVGNPSPSSRSAELPCNEHFAAFIADELMPWIRRRGLNTRRERTIVAGASYGGLAAAFLGFKHPEIFGNVFSQSGSFWWSPGGFQADRTEETQWLTRQFVAAPPQPVRYYLQAGTFEQPSEILQTTRHLRDCLRAKGYAVEYQEFVGGHGYFYWRHRFADGIVGLLGEPTKTTSD